MKQEELTLYRDLLGDIKTRVRQAQHRAALSANAEMILMYWDIGRLIAARQKEEGWGAGVIPRLAADLKNELPEQKGFSERNIGRMIAFYREYPILPLPVAKIGAQVAPQLQPVDPEDRTILPRAVAKLPMPPEILLRLSWAHHIILFEKLKDFPIRLDLLFYHLHLRCFVVVDLKKGEFKPEYAGKMNFYCSAVDDLLRHAHETATIGLILCQTQDRIFAEYALRDIHKPIGVADYELTRALPKDLASSLPSIEDIEAEMMGSMKAEL
jgi:predicted nuclease of restriction endonuclease-like (RecB) superfamily